MNTTYKLDHIVVLRSIAIVLVVLGHATRDMNHPNVHMYSPSVTPLLEILIKKYIYTFHIPLFFWISGYVHYYSAIELPRHTNLLMGIKKKIKRLVIPYYATSFLVLLPTIYLWGHPHGTLKVMVGNFLLCTHADHLWFLPTLFIFFLVFIPGKRLLNRTPVIIVVTILFVLSARRTDFHLYLRTPLYYAIYFYAGYASRKHHFFLNSLKNVFSAVCFFLLHMACYLVSLAKEPPEYLLLNYLTAFLGIYYSYALTSISTPSLKQKYWKYLSALDQASLTIYLFHVSVIYLVLYLFSGKAGSPALYRVLLSFLFGVIAPYAIYHIASKNYFFQLLFGIPKQGREVGVPKL